MVETEQLIRELSDQAAPVKPVLPRQWALRLLSVLLVYGGAMLWSMGLRPDWLVQLTRPLFAAEILLLVGLLLSAAITSVLMMYPDAYQQRGLLRVPYLLSFLLLALLSYQGLLPLDPRMQMPTPQSHTVECALFIAMAAVLPAALILMLLKKGATLAPVRAGALAVITSTTLSALALRLSEPIDTISHLLIWHYIPTIFFAMIGAWLGRLMLKW